MTTAVMHATEPGQARPPSGSPAGRSQNAEQLGRAKKMFDEVNELEADDMASLSVALRLLRSIVRR